MFVIPLAGAAAVLAAASAAADRFTWNHTPSLPLGLYRLDPASVP